MDLVRVAGLLEDWRMHKLWHITVVSSQVT
jgi:hypothetical protein